MVKFASDLEKHPLFKQKQMVDAPVSVGLKNLMTEKGNRLEIMTNVTSETFVRAVFIGGIYTNIYGSRYVMKRIEQMERIATAKDGLARKQNIEMVEAGGNLPSEYYGINTSNRRWTPVGVAPMGVSEDDQKE